MHQVVDGVRILRLLPDLVPEIFHDCHAVSSGHVIAPVLMSRASGEGTRACLAGGTTGNGSFRWSAAYATGNGHARWALLRVDFDCRDGSEVRAFAVDYHGPSGSSIQCVSGGS